MSKSSAQATVSSAPGLTRSMAALPLRSNSLGQHICVQRQAARSAIQPAAPSLVREAVSGPGRPLDTSTRSEMETRLGHDFSQVRVHTDEQAAESAKAVGANAYATGTHLAFAPGRYSPETANGRSTLVHELSHVVQQSSGRVSGTEIGQGVSVSDPADRFEREAQAASKATSPAAKPDSIAPRLPSNPMQSPQGRSLFVQRDTDPATAAAEKSAKAGVYSAVFGGLSAFEAIRSAGFAGRQAETAEDPPIATPTTAGVTANDVDIPESKGISAKHLKDYSEKETVDEEIQYGQVKNEDGSDRAKGGANPHTKITTTHKEAESADTEKRLHLLHVTQDTTNSADFYVNLVHSGTDIKGGTTEQGEFRGYKGGTNNANLSLNFKASKGAQLPVEDKSQGTKAPAEKPETKAPDDKQGAKAVDEKKDLTGTVRLAFRGTNAPPRKILSSGLGAGFASFLYGGGGPKENKNYDKLLQNFNGAVRLTGKGTAEAHEEEGHKGVTYPKGGDGTNGPVATVALNTGDTPSTSGQPAVQDSGTPTKAGGGSSAPAPGTPAASGGGAS